MIDDMLDHTCNIYHMASTPSTVGFNIGTETFSYPDTPDERGIKCHFNVSADGTLTQTELANEYIVTGKLQLPPGTDIRVNDKIVDCDNNLEYYAQIPKNIRNHHMIVTIYRRGTVKGAI